ncbi:erythromycin esterase family protein [Steroidobacter sp.]|uniref:erythromycin esterase family protein n=1 Tax=Steroidobacter sp. TaxID=1978227 RepID=UPI001A3647BB|nr:erythromycin esterase family protein [Steroidobacter sp.]MBL8268984.1 erythromycin esterase family protein [Steroidobacter sp.]
MRPVESPVGTTVSWAAGRVAPLDDWRALEQIIAGARVIGLAEFAHVQPECLALRNRMLEYLVTQQGLTALAAETGFTYSVAVDEYVLGRGSAEPLPEVVHGVFAWNPNQVAENRELIRWMREYNGLSSTRRKVRFHGIDLNGFRPGTEIFARARQAADDALSYIGARDARLAESFAERLRSGLSHFDGSKHASLSASQWRDFSASLVELAAAFEQQRAAWLKQGTALDYERARRNVRLVQQHDADFHAAPAAGSHADTRDAAMAENLEWVLEQEGPQGRVMLFASFNHLTKGPNPYYEERQLGRLLEQRLGRQYVAIGTYWPSESSAGRRNDANGLADPLLRPLAALSPEQSFLLAMNERPFDARWMSARGSFFDAIIFMKVREQPYEW